MSESTPHRRWGTLITAAIWAVGVGLQFAAPLLRDRVPLSDDLFIGSFLAPWWSLGQVMLLAGFLTLFRKAADGWNRGRRKGFAIAGAVLFSLLQPEFITQLVGNEVPLADNPVRVALLWSTPLAFYMMPAALVVYSWLKRDARLTLPRALGVGLVVIGLLNFPYILWLTRLWRLYVEPQGGEGVFAPWSLLAVGLTAGKRIEQLEQEAAVSSVNFHRAKRGLRAS